ncbi:hypothetical protein G3545_29150 [Starkeya sp. ORNL1]|uniref:hypothetical protein n=1 Tax=Starkeya sp. ORNL1 TaxID=2709380 RepID=UPI001462E4F3|nr:hypothetical protein [Starkeya sp. ORNL1]QJP17352.1 hypothetical protein G3545_29150 [Starkeya sp. ORNL1]
MPPLLFTFEPRTIFTYRSYRLPATTYSEHAMSPDYAKRVRVVLAFVVSPLVPALLGVALAAFARGDPGIIFSTATLWAAKITITFGYQVVLAIGVPLYLVLRKYRLTGI